MHQVKISTDVSPEGHGGKSIKKNIEVKRNKSKERRPRPNKKHPSAYQIIKDSFG